MWQNIAGLIGPAPLAEPITDGNLIKRQYAYWRFRIMYSCFIGYVIFYFVRQNMSIAMPVMEKALGISKAGLGTFLTLHKVLYGVSKFLNGILGDRTNPRYFMAFGLLMSAIMNIFFGLSTAVVTLGIFWMLNGWFQGMGFPPCARCLSHWFSPKERGTKWAFWNSSHQFGAGIILVLGGFLISRRLDLQIPGLPSIHLAGWQLCFFIPALISIAASIFLVNRLRDTPGSLGLPPIEEYMQEETVKEDYEASFEKKTFQRLMLHFVLGSRRIWLLSLANFFVYILRYAFLDWAPTCLSETKGVILQHAGWMTAGFEMFGLVGAIVAGWITDRYFKSRRAPLCAFYMVATLCLVFLFWKVPPGNTAQTMIIMFALGFFIYGPQFLVAVMAADISTKHAAATAIGLTGLFGYLSSIVSGWGLGFTVDHYGWDGAFWVLLICAALATLLFVSVWNARPTRESELLSYLEQAQMPRVLH